MKRVRKERESYKMSSRFEKIACSTIPSIPNKDRLRQLEQLLRTRLPESVHILNLCRIAIQDRFRKQACIQFYGYVEGDKNDSTWEKGQDSFIVCIERPNIHANKGILALTPSMISQEMAHAFDTLIGWDEPQVFQTIPQPLWPALQELCTIHGNLKPGDSEGIPRVLLGILDLEKGKGLDISCQSNITLRPLEQENVPEMVQNWKWAEEGSEEEIVETVKSMVSCGAFNEEGEMLSSVLLSSLGLFNVLHTPEKFRRKGYALLVMRFVSKEAAKLGIHPLAEVEIWNGASRGMLEKVGFDEVYRTKWFYFNPSAQRN